MNQVLKQSILVAFSFITLAVVGVVHVEAASLEFDPASSEIEEGETFSVDVTIDAGTKQVAGTDIYITYDSSIVSLQSVTGGDYFPLVSNIPTTDKLYISGVIANQGEYKTGTGTVATLVFKGEAEGTTELKFTCDLTQTETSKINQNDINASNIIDCSTLTAHAVTVGGDGTAATTKPTSLPASGVYGDMMRYTALGGVLLVAGLGLRLIMKIV
ncbi:hypothetical protein IPM65_03930 [Candidatus Roizmanbacteria bacterium]|nr:MAG: hypothetical protein IPM65_03930 [Candidatus Roizmanbacteria bacterium]